MADSNSTRTAIPKTTSEKSQLATAQEKSGRGANNVVDNIWAALIRMLMITVRFLQSVIEVISDICVKIYRILLFCYRKPHHAKELFCSTIHIIKVSYDAEIWTCADIWEVLKSQLITPMTKCSPGQSVKSVKQN